MSNDDRTPDAFDGQLREAFRRHASRIEAHVDARAGLDHIKEPTMTRRTLIPAIAAAAVLVAAIGVVVILQPFGGEPVAGSTTTTISSTTTVPTTSTTEPTTSTTEATSTTTTTTVPTVPWNDGRYQVVGVAADDVLNVRQSPGAGEPIVGTLPPGGLVTLDGYSARVGSSEWLSVRLEDGTIGWVNGAFLTPPASWEVPLDEVACTPDGDAYGGTQQPSGDPAPREASNVLSIFTYESADCTRLVFVLGDGQGLEGAQWSSTPAATVPAGTSVTSGGAIVELRIPTVVAARPIAQTTDAAGGGFVLATRDQPLSQGTNDLTLRAFFDANRRAAITLLSEPARVVIDIRNAPTGTGLDVAAKRSGTTVVMPIQADVNGPGVGLPITVTGWGRPFESQGVAVLRTVAAQPGAGDPVEATFSGTDFVGTQRTSQYPYTTADYTEAWGAFSFTIDDLAPGSYELFVGDFNMESGAPEGIYQVFTVAG